MDDRPAFMRLVVPTPLGRALFVAAAGGTIVTSEFCAAHTRSRSAGALGARIGTRSGDPLLREARAQVRAYFAKRLRRFDLPLRLEGTPLQVAIWQLVAGLEWGDLVCYADVASAVGAPGAHRAVAAAMREAPFALFVPAHRVIGADGRIHGAARGSMRRRLLAFEGHAAIARRA